jgi:hypothetical protein
MPCPYPILHSRQLCDKRHPGKHPFRQFAEPSGLKSWVSYALRSVTSVHRHQEAGGRPIGRRCVTTTSRDNTLEASAGGRGKLMDRQSLIPQSLMWLWGAGLDLYGPDGGIASRIILGDYGVDKIRIVHEVQGGTTTHIDSFSCEIRT